MKLKINNVRISLRQEQTLEQAVCRKCGIPREALGSVRIVRKAVDARKKNDICLNYHVLAEVETGGRQAKRLLADRDITQYQEQQQPTLELGTLPLSAPPVVIGAGPAGLWRHCSWRSMATSRCFWSAASRRRSACRMCSAFGRRENLTPRPTFSLARAVQAPFGRQADYTCERSHDGRNPATVCRCRRAGKYFV